MRRGLQPYALAAQPASSPVDSAGSPAVSLPARLAAAAAFIQIHTSSGASVLGPPWVRSCFPGVAAGGGGVAEGARPARGGREGPALSYTPHGPDGGTAQLLLQPGRDTGGRPSLMK
ncbi:UNVERIFIED_CONTAM: hypothetical protein K2H54_056720 [Gekko kuhli]